MCILICNGWSYFCCSGKLWICHWAELGTLQTPTEVRTRTVLHPEQKYPTPTPSKVITFIAPLIPPRRNFRITLLPAVTRLNNSSQTALGKLECEQCTVCGNYFALDIFFSTQYGTFSVYSAVIQNVNFLGSEIKKPSLQQTSHHHLSIHFTLHFIAVPCCYLLMQLS